MAEAPVYESPTPYEETRIHAAAIYCSDGRVGEQIDDFLHRSLGLPRYDRLAIPGGRPVSRGAWSRSRKLVRSRTPCAS